MYNNIIKRLKIECTSTTKLHQRSDFINFDGCVFDFPSRTIQITMDTPIHALMVLRYLGKHFSSGGMIELPRLCASDPKKWRYFFEVAEENDRGIYVANYSLLFKNYQQHVEAYAYLRGLSYEEKYLPSYIGPFISFVQSE